MNTALKNRESREVWNSSSHAHARPDLAQDVMSRRVEGFTLPMAFEASHG